MQPAVNRKKKLLLADMDSTMIGQECIDELADYVGMKAHVAAITERAMRGEIAFEPALRERVALLKDLPLSVIDEVIAQRITLTPGARALVDDHAHERRLHLSRLRRLHRCSRAASPPMIGFDENRANTLEVADEKLLGNVDRADLRTRGQARHAARTARRAAGSTAATHSSIGDGANDLDMIGEAGLGVAYHAKPKVAEAAAARIDHGDLTALLYMQGYRQGRVRRRLTAPA